jgi:hypothetical protein
LFLRKDGYLLTYLLTPWCRIFEKLIVTQLVKKYPAFLRNPKVHHRAHKSPPLDPILSQPNPVRPIDPYLPKVHLNVILPPMPRSSQWSLAFGQVVIITIIISKQDRHPHKSTKIHMTQKKTVTPAHGSSVYPSGRTPHERQYRNVLPS